MASFERDSITIHHEIAGDGFPVLLLAPGGMRSAIPRWSAVGFEPQSILAEHGFRTIAMDQRNAGQSTAPISGDDGWHSYAADQLALLDHLGVDRCHVLGSCIGGSFILKLLETAPERFASAVLLQPIGHSAKNRETFFQLFDGWADELGRDRAATDGWASFRHNMFGGDFVFSVDRDFVRSCQAPMLVLMGNDQFHPSVTSREIAELAPNAELIEQWKVPPHVEPALDRIVRLFQQHAG